MRFNSKNVDALLTRKLYPQHKWTILILNSMTAPLLETLIAETPEYHKKIAGIVTIATTDKPHSLLEQYVTSQSQTLRDALDHPIKWVFAETILNRQARWKLEWLWVPKQWVWWVNLWVRDYKKRLHQYEEELWKKIIADAQDTGIHRLYLANEGDQIVPPIDFSQYEIADTIEHHQFVPSVPGQHGVELHLPEQQQVLRDWFAKFE